MSSVPNALRVELNAVALQERQEFLLKRQPLVMLGLARNVLNDLLGV
jgi:hypothetical protein